VNDYPCAKMLHTIKLHRNKQIKGVSRKDAKNAKKYLSSGF
jgi:hypothetical protein